MSDISFKQHMHIYTHTHRHAQCCLPWLGQLPEPEHSFGVCCQMKSPAPKVHIHARAQGLGREHLRATFCCITMATLRKTVIWPHGLWCLKKAFTERACAQIHTQLPLTWVGNQYSCCRPASTVCEWHSKVHLGFITHNQDKGEPRKGQSLYDSNTA